MATVRTNGGLLGVAHRNYCCAAGGQRRRVHAAARALRIATPIQIVQSSAIGEHCVIADRRQTSRIKSLSKKCNENMVRKRVVCRVGDRRCNGGLYLAAAVALRFVAVSAAGICCGICAG